MTPLLKRFKSLNNYTRKFVKREIDYLLNSPNDILLFLTYRCTSKCKACTIWKREVDRRSELTIKDYERFFKDVFDYKNTYNNVEFFGGDALLRRDILPSLISMVKEKGIRTSLPTNGNLLDEELAKGLVNAGLDIVEVSIDSIENIHDTMRGVNGTFARAKNAIINIMRARKDRDTPKIQINTTVSKMNYKTIEEILKFGEEIGVEYVAFEYIGEFPDHAVKMSGINGKIPEPYFISENGSHLLSIEEAKELKYIIKNIKKESQTMRVNCITRNIDDLTIYNMMKGEFPRRKCYMSHSLITLDPYGNILGCPFYNNYSIGNIKERKFSEIWNNDLHIYFKRIVNDKETKPPMCNYCILAVERNPSFIGSFKRLFYINRKTGKHV